MPIVHSKPTGERGKKDAKRHRNKQREVMKENLPDIISQEDIITDRKGKKVKIPIRGIQIPDFRPGRRKKSEEEGIGRGRGGIGQGSGQPGDIIDRREGKGTRPGKGAGDEPGEDFIETEVDIEEIIEMMMEDLGLPNIKKKEKAELEVILGFSISGIRKSGPYVLIEKNRSASNAIERFWVYLEILKSETSLDELMCYSALLETGGDLTGAFELLEDSEYKATEKEVAPFPIFEEEDLEFHDIKERKTHESNAVIIMELDVSGSMDVMKKYLARSMMFWLVEFLRKIYNNVEVRFIVYHSTARIVDEHTAFHTTESGGTIAREAHDKVVSRIEAEYPTDKWNVYVFQFSDGWDFYPDTAVEGTRKLIEDYTINMFGYSEIHVNEFWPISSNLYDKFYEKLPLEKRSDTDKNLEVLLGKDDYPFVGVRIDDKDKLWPAIKEFLKKDRWS